MRFIPLFVFCLAAFGAANAFGCDEVSWSPSNSTTYTSSNVTDETPVNTSYDRSAQYNDNYATPMYSDRKQEYSGGAYRNYPGDYDRRMDRDMENRDDRYSRREFSDRGDGSSGVHVGTGTYGHGGGVEVGTHGVGVNAH